MDETTFRWFRASVVLSAVTLIVVLANSATNWRRYSTDEEQIVSLQTRMKTLEDEHSKDEGERIHQQNLEQRRADAQTQFNNRVLDILDPARKKQ